MTQHPYKNLPPHCFWRASIGQVAPAEVDPVVRGSFPVAPTDRVATAGSCFAQHIARHLQGAGFAFMITEQAHPIVPAEVAKQFNYGLFTARYGNIYTSRQLVQLLQRVYGLFSPDEDIWIEPDGRVLDPFRPQIQPGGFASEAEFRMDRERHFASIRRMVEDMDVFVFTLGLTEVWVSAEDGAAYPLCPGVAGGRFDPARHRFVNLRVADVVADMLQAVDLIRERNPAVRVILTVSPVPLVATAEDRSVLQSTTYSKSVLRAACGELESMRPDLAYFPSYEVITGNYNRGSYYGPDLRDVTERGVAHVMRLFMQHYTTQEAGPPARGAEPAIDRHIEQMEEIVRAVCDEEALNAG